VADPLDQLQRAEFFAPFLAAELDDLQGRLGPARRGGLPDLAETAASQKAGQTITRSGDGLVALAVGVRHEKGSV
jgi:hypothetical protein